MITMEFQSTEQVLFRRKRKIAIFSGLFIGLLIMFTLLSNTLMALTLPKVAVVMPSKGDLVHSFLGSSVLKWRAETALNNSSGSRVKKVHVKEGELAKKGQVLVTYDQKEAEQQILDEKGNLAKLKLSMEELQNNFVEAMQSEDEKAINDAERAWKLSSIDLDAQQRRLKKLQDDLIEKRDLIAPFDGSITQVNAIENLVSSAGPDVIISNCSLGLQFELSVPADMVEQLETGAKLQVQVNGSSPQQIEGQVENIQDMNSVNQVEGDNLVQMKRLLVTVQDKTVKEGEKVQVELTTITEDAILVPNKAIHEEGTSKYVFGIEEKDGPLGNVVYVRKINITVVDSNQSLSAVTGGLFEQESIIIESSDPLQEGDKIRK